MAKKILLGILAAPLIWSWYVGDSRTFLGALGLYAVGGVIYWAYSAGRDAATPTLEDMIANKVAEIRERNKAVAEALEQERKRRQTQEGDIDFG